MDSLYLSIYKLKLRTSFEV